MDKIYSICTKVSPVGSRVTCNPPPTDTDEDFLCLVDRDRFYELIETIHQDGYELGGSDIVPCDDYSIDKWEGFQSHKKGVTNLIITCSESFFDKFMVATGIAKKENLMLKSERVALFQHILYDFEYTKTT